MIPSAARRLGTSPSFWNKYNRLQDDMIAACMPSLPPLDFPQMRRVHPRPRAGADYGTRRVYSA